MRARVFEFRRSPGRPLILAYEGGEAKLHDTGSPDIISVPLEVFCRLESLGTGSSQKLVVGVEGVVDWSQEFMLPATSPHPKVSFFMHEAVTLSFGEKCTFSNPHAHVRIRRAHKNTINGATLSLVAEVWGYADALGEIQISKRFDVH